MRIHSSLLCVCVCVCVRERERERERVGRGQLWKTPLHYLHVWLTETRLYEKYNISRAIVERPSLIQYQTVQQQVNRNVMRVCVYV